MKDTYLVESFKTLGAVINYKDMEISSLKYENKQLKEKLASLEVYVESLSKSTSK